MFVVPLMEKPVEFDRITVRPAKADPLEDLVSTVKAKAGSGEVTVKVEVVVDVSLDVEVSVVSDTDVTVVIVETGKGWTFSMNWPVVSLSVPGNS